MCCLPAAPLLKGSVVQLQQPAVQEGETNGMQEESEDNDEASPTAFSQDDEEGEERRDVSSSNSDSRGRGKNRFERRGYRSHRGGRGGGSNHLHRVASGGGAGPHSVAAGGQLGGGVRGTGMRESRSAYQGGRMGGGQYRQQRPLRQRGGGGEAGVGRRGQATESGDW